MGEEEGEGPRNGMKYSEDKYEGSFTIPAPKGVYQADGESNLSTEYAYRAQNIRT